MATPKFQVTNFNGNFVVHGNREFLDHLVGLVEYFKDGEGGKLDTVTYAFLTKLEHNAYYLNGRPTPE